VFSLPARFATATGVLGAIIAWIVAGTGMLMLAFVFQTLAIRKPELDSGIFAYAKAGFGDYIGFNSAFGYWASACTGNAFYWVFIMSTIGAAFPALGHGDTLLAAAISTVGVWAFHFLIARGVRDAAVINRIVTIAKIVPILVFIIILIFAFDGGLFAANFWGGEAATVGSIFNQVKGTMIITVFVFLGIEGASVYSRTPSDAKMSAGPLWSASLVCWRSLRWSACFPTRCCRNKRSPGCGSRPWRQCWQAWWVTGALSSSASASWCRCSAPTWPGR
jgi:arginine:ornithine antiporter/lysine permease